MTYRPDETVYCRFTREALTVISCDGCVAVVRGAAGESYPVPVGYLTRFGV